MIPNQKHLFSLSEEITYLNGSYMSPQLKSVEQVGLDALRKKSQPYLISENDFFSDKEVLRKRFSQLIGCDDPQRIAIIPSVSFGIGTVLKNIPFRRNDEIILLKEQFPSNYYAWAALVDEIGVKLKIIDAPEIGKDRGKLWNQRILEAITSKTKCIAIPHVHWADGTKYDLRAIRKRSKEVNAYLIIDGTQSVGALPFSVKEIQPDALICGGYKWLLGPYSLGVAYFGERFDHGVPLDNNWMNHEGAENFSNLINYNPLFKPKAARYDIGESSNFNLVPMLSEAIRQLILWTPEAIQSYCREISEESILRIQNLGIFIEEPEYRAHHLFGIFPSEEYKLEKIKEKISEKKIIVSFRGKSIRVSPNVYNSKDEIEKLLDCFLEY
ncbi:aminotransferase class V-fold PLP-dependent enzyme [Ulvibacter antarcticus]|uniref:Selenocysteine lyase/cysteine desulfurase n=1 Tax=Ulvibacter antarcticus TaxID=442714 RepID=A0A3L9Z424_9FLAO|nr:aminotransferase class V-fold PLP-dependent enzyme [Ulvibacter antarcticus]RMA66179.1 selenocysteine lyase/cysteine desulfurase [Ulvibacter antarcticus]